MDGIIINRISSLRQDDGYSLDQQLKINRNAAKSANTKIVNEFNIIESAKNFEKRDEFHQALDFIKKNKNVKFVFIEKIDRLTRNMSDAVLAYELVNNHEITFIFTRDNQRLSKDSNSHEKFQFDIKAVLAKNYIDNLSEEVKKGQRGMLEEGKWPGGSTALGYIKINKLLVPDPERARFVSMTFELYATGSFSLKLLKKKLDEEGFRTRSNKPLTKSNYHQILTNPVYYGVIRWKEKLSPGIHQPLIDKILFYKVQIMLHRTKNGEVIPTYAKHDFTYRGILQCGECGAKITAELKTKKNKGNGNVHTWVYYHCTHYKECSQKGSVREEYIEDQILSLFSKFKIGTHTTNWLKQMLKESHFEEIEYRQRSLNDLNIRHLHVQNCLDRLYDDKIDGTIDEGTYDRKRNQYLVEQEDILYQIKRHSVADKKYVDFGSLILDIANRAAEIYKVRNTDEKRYLLKLVFSNLSLKDKKLQISFNSIFQALFNYQKTKDVLALGNVFRTNDWIIPFEPIEANNSYLSQFLSI